jgi:hypothetical protein
MVKHLLTVACLTLALFSATPGESRADGLDNAPRVIVVAHGALRQSNVGLAELREMFTGSRRFWQSGERVEVILTTEKGLSRRFSIERVARMSELQFQQHWISQVFNQRATRLPRAAPNRRLTLALVAAIPGAVALVEEGELPPNVRVLTLDGLSSGDTGYPLR